MAAGERSELKVENLANSVAGTVLGFKLNGAPVNMVLGAGITFNDLTNTLSVAGGGTVTSVTVDGGTTGLTFSGGAIVDEGTATMSGTLKGVNGGTDQNGMTVGALLQASTTSTWSQLAAGALGNVLITGGANTVSTWGKVGLTTHVSGILPFANGGFGFNTTVTGDLFVGGPSNTVTKLGKGAAGTFLQMNATVPFWGAPPGITNTAAAFEVGMSDNTNIVPSGIFVKVLGTGVLGNLTLGSTALTGDRSITALNTASNAVLSLLSQSGIIQLGAPGGGTVTTLRTSTTGASRACLEFQFGGLGSSNNPAYRFTSATAAGWDGSANTQYLMNYVANIASQTGTAAFSMHSSVLSLGARTATGKAYLFTYGLGGVGDVFNLTAKGVLEVTNATTAPGILSGYNQVYGKQINALSELCVMNESGQENCLTSLQFNSQSGTNYPITMADSNKDINMSSASANTITIPLNATVAFPIGTVIGVNQYGAGQTSFVGAIGVTIRSASSFVKIAARYSGAVLKKIGADEWLLQGNLSA